jgi:hypothetical protein
MSETQLSEVMAELDPLADPKVREANEKRGDDHGVNLSKLRELAKRLKTHHETGVCRAGDAREVLFSCD